MKTEYIKNLEPYNELWIKVIKRAVDDIVSFQNPKNQSEEEIYNSAYEFLFDDDYEIFIDDYWIEYYCEGCDTIINEKISSFSISFTCGNCKKMIENNLFLSNLLNQKTKVIKAKDLFCILGVQNIGSFRKKLKKLIMNLIEKQENKRKKKNKSL